MSEVPSPCTQVCRLDPSRGWCVGCLRTGGEIAAWTRLDDAGRREVLERCEARKGPAGDGRGL